MGFFPFFFTAKTFLPIECLNFWLVRSSGLFAFYICVSASLMLYCINVWGEKVPPTILFPPNILSSYSVAQTCERTKILEDSLRA